MARKNVGFRCTLPELPIINLFAAVRSLMDERNNGMINKTANLMIVFLMVLAAGLTGCGSGGGDSSAANVSVSVNQMAGFWMRQDGVDAGIKGKEYLADGTGYLGNFSSGSFARASLFTWSLSNAASAENRVDGLFHEQIILFDGTNMQQERQEDHLVRIWQKQ